MSRLDGLELKRFGRLVVMYRLGEPYTSRSGRVYDTIPMYMCKCDCGNEKAIPAISLIGGHTESCGCYQNECRKVMNLKYSSKYNKRIYRIWNGMIGRCERKSSINYENYGGRGIKICDEWHNFNVFYDWAINNGYSDDLTIDRIDVNGNYEPSNCRWATYHEQNLNRRSNALITYNGETKTISEWSEAKNINYSMLRNRLYSGMTPEEAIETPPNFNQKKFIYNGQCMNLRQIAEHSVVAGWTVMRRLKSGWTLEDAMKIPANARRPKKYKYNRNSN